MSKERGRERQRENNGGREREREKKVTRESEGMLVEGASSFSRFQAPSRLDSCKAKKRIEQ